MILELDRRINGLMRIQIKNQSIARLGKILNLT